MRRRSLCETVVAPSRNVVRVRPAADSWQVCTLIQRDNANMQLLGGSGLRGRPVQRRNSGLAVDLQLAVQWLRITGGADPEPRSCLLVTAG